MISHRALLWTGGVEAFAVIAGTQIKRRLHGNATAWPDHRNPVLALLTVSTGLAILILGVVWFVFFRT
jgi:hypothetical protein